MVFSYLKLRMPPDLKTLAIEVMRTGTNWATREGSNRRAATEMVASVLRIVEGIFIAGNLRWNGACL